MARRLQVGMTSGDTIGEEMIIRGPKFADQIGWSILVHTKHIIKIGWFILSIFTESVFSLPFLLWLDLLGPGGSAMGKSSSQIGGF